MHHIMFDIDGTLIDSYELDTQCFIDAVRDVTGITIDSDWSTYQHVTDSGILKEFFQTHNISNQKEIESAIKIAFIEKLTRALELTPTQQIAGASEFITTLKSEPNIVISFATGGWRESAMLKLASAGIEYHDIVLASSNDHYSRTEIMKYASLKNGATGIPCTYFGDGVWDRKACQDLSYNFVLVGERFQYQPSISNFLSPSKILNIIHIKQSKERKHVLADKLKR